MAVKPKEQIHREIPPLVHTGSTVIIGSAGEQFALYNLMRAGFTVFKPTYPAKACDLLVQSPSGNYYRCEVKTACDGHLRFYRVLNGRHRCLTQTYNPNEFDIGIGVDLANEVISFIPMTELPKSGQVYVSPRNVFAAHINDFSVFK